MKVICVQKLKSERNTNKTNQPDTGNLFNTCPPDSIDRSLTFSAHNPIYRLFSACRTYLSLSRSHTDTQREPHTSFTTAYFCTQDIFTCTEIIVCLHLAPQIWPGTYIVNATTVNDSCTRCNAVLPAHKVYTGSMTSTRKTSIVTKVGTNHHPQVYLTLSAHMITQDLHSITHSTDSSAKRSFAPTLMWAEPGGYRQYHCL